MPIHRRDAEPTETTQREEELLYLLSLSLRYLCGLCVSVVKYSFADLDNAGCFKCPSNQPPTLQTGVA